MEAYKWTSSWNKSADCEAHALYGWWSLGEQRLCWITIIFLVNYAQRQRSPWKLVTNVKCIQLKLWISTSDCQRRLDLNRSSSFPPIFSLFTHELDDISPSPASFCGFFAKIPFLCKYVRDFRLRWFCISNRQFEIQCWVGFTSYIRQSSYNSCVPAVFRKYVPA